jgi:hypothetical protein
MIATAGNPHPFCIAWERYLKDRDRAQLLTTLSTLADQPSGHQFLLWMAIGASDWELVRMLEVRHVRLWHGEDDQGQIYEAVYDFGDALSAEAVKWLVDQGAPIDEHRRNVCDWTALHLACRNGYFGAAKALVENGANVNTQTGIDGGWTPLMEACAGGSKAVVEFLLAHGAGAEVRNLYGGGTARNIAAKHGHPEIAELLDAWTNSRARRVKEAWKKKRESRRKKQ